MESLLTRVKREIQILSLLGLNKGKILDVGFGSGRYLKNLNGDLVCALEKNRRRIVELKNFKNVMFILGDAEDLPFKKNIFDKVLFTEVLEHTQKPYKALSDLKTVVRNGGTLIMSCPSANYPFLWDSENYIREFLGKRPRKKKSMMTNWTPGHKHLFSYSELEAELLPEFQIKSTIYSGHILTPILNIVWFLIYGLVKIVRYLNFSYGEKIIQKVFDSILKVSMWEDEIFNCEPCITLMIKAIK